MSLVLLFLVQVPSVCAYLSIYRRRLCICIIWKLTVNWRVANWKSTKQKEQRSTDSNDGPVILVPVFVVVDSAGACSVTLPLCIRQTALLYQKDSSSSSSTRAEGRPAGPFACTQSSSSTAVVANLRCCLSPFLSMSVGLLASYLLVTSGPSAATVGRQFIIHRVSIEATLHLSFLLSTSLSCFVLNFHLQRTTFISPSTTTPFILQRPNCKQIRLCRITF